MASLKFLATVLLLLAILLFSESTRPTFVESESSTMDQALEKTPIVGTQALTNPCHPQDISIQQYEASGSGILVWQVQITNLCTNPLCMISKVIVQCGAFHTPTLVNPHVFRRLDAKAGTCIVNDGNRIENADTVSFQYSEIMKEPLTLKSAKVTCW